MGREILCDPQVLASWIDDNPDRWQYLSDPDPEPDARRQVADLLRLLGTRDSDAIKAHYLHGWSTRRMARMSQIAQPSIMERLQRAILRLRFLGNRPDYDLELMLLHLSESGISNRLSLIVESVIRGGTLHAAAGYLACKVTQIRCAVREALSTGNFPDLSRVYLTYLVEQEPRHQYTAQAPTMPKGRRKKFTEGGSGNPPHCFP